MTKYRIIKGVNYNANEYYTIQIKRFYFWYTPDYLDHYYTTIENAKSALDKYITAIYHKNNIVSEGIVFPKET